jgi:hypothetical protein
MLLKLSKFLKNIAFRCKQKSLYYELLYYIKHKKTFLKNIKYYDRGIGKTYSLVKLAHKFKCPIAIHNSISENYIQSMSIRHFGKRVETVLVNRPERITRRFEMLLAEEGLNYDCINELIKRCDILVGYQFPAMDNRLKFEKEYECIWIK